MGIAENYLLNKYHLLKKIRVHKDFKESQGIIFLRCDLKYFYDNRNIRSFNFFSRGRNYQYQF